MNVVKQTIIKVLTNSSRPMMEHSFLVIGDFGKAFYSKNGKEALPIITEVANKSGAERAEIMRKMMPVKNMKDVGEMFKMLDLTMELGLETVESSNDTFHFKVARCPYGLEGTTKELCETMMTADKKMISTLLGKEIEMKVAQNIAAGDKICEVTFSKK